MKDPASTPGLVGQGGLRDPDDDQILAIAVAGVVDALVTGDADLLALARMAASTSGPLPTSRCWRGAENAGPLGAHPHPVHAIPTKSITRAGVATTGVGGSSAIYSRRACRFDAHLQPTTFQGCARVGDLYGECRSRPFRPTPPRRLPAQTRRWACQRVASTVIRQTLGHPSVQQAHSSRSRDCGTSGGQRRRPGRAAPGSWSSPSPREGDKA